MKQDSPTSDRSRSALKTWPGKPYPLGATWDGAGVNFALVLGKCQPRRALPV